MKNPPQKKTPMGNPPQKMGTSGERRFFTQPARERTAITEPDFKVRLGGVPLETRASFELLSRRIRQLLTASPGAWDEIEREEAGSFWTLFAKYHIPLLVPFFFFFAIHELMHFVKWRLMLRHLAIMLPLGVAIYAAYIFVIGILAEETAEHSGGRYAPQSGMRIAIFSTLILSFLSVAYFLPVIGKPLLLLGIFWHYRQLFTGARTLLHISDSNFKAYCLSHLLVWVVLGLAGFFLLSLVSFISSRLGLLAI